MNKLGACFYPGADRIIRNEPYLTTVDSAIGDGDHGIGMKNGMTAARKYLETAEGETNVYALYANMAEAMQQAMGGASGMIFSTLFAGRAAEKLLRGDHSLGSGQPDEGRSTGYSGARSRGSRR